MIAEATARAREGAEQFARDSGSRVGAIRRANQGTFEILPRDRVPGASEDDPARQDRARGVDRGRTSLEDSMARINEHYRKLQAGYLFPEIGRRVRAFSEANPDGARDPARHRRRHAAARARDRRGDARRRRRDGHARRASAATAPSKATTSCSRRSASTTIAARGVEIAADEIFVSDGSKQDSGNIQEIFGDRCAIAVTDPVYPVYVDTNVMAGRTGAAGAHGRYAGHHLPARRPSANGFVPDPPARAGRRRLPLLAEQPDRRRR